MRALLWTSYAGLLAVGVVYYLMSAFERAYERVTLPQLLYVMYLLALTTFSGMSMRDVPLALTFAAVPAAVFTWLTMGDEPEDWTALREEKSRRLAEAKRALDGDSRDVLALESLADVYVEIGAVPEALEAYRRLISIYSDPAKPGLGRLLTAALGKEERLRLSGAAAAPDARVPALLKTCPDCGAVVLRSAYACRCGRELNGGPWTRRAIVANAAFERWGLLKTTLFGLAFLPYLRWCGVAAYGLLLGAWTLAFANSRGAPRPVGLDPAADMRALWTQGALLAALFLGFVWAPSARSASDSRPAPPARESGPPKFEFTNALSPRMTTGELADKLARAKQLEALADAKAVESQAAQEAAFDLPPSKEEPAAVVAEMTALLSAPDAERRVLAAQTLCDLRYAAYGETAVPALERLKDDPDAELRDSAALALFRIRFCASSALCRSKYRR